MSSYNPQRKRNLFYPWSETPFKLSRSKIDLFLRCPRCFYLDRRLGIAPPPPWPYTLNSAVGSTLGREFDKYRQLGEPHPLMREAAANKKIKAAIPFSHPSLDLWRDGFRHGISFRHKQTNLDVFGGVDDVWQFLDCEELVIVDYKSTAQGKEIDISDPRYDLYKKQIEIYQWLFRRNGFLVSRTACFLFCNADPQQAEFNGQLKFKMEIVPYKGDDSWVEQTLTDVKKCLQRATVPNFSANCDNCQYTQSLLKYIRSLTQV